MPGFYRNYGIFRKEIQSDIPGLLSDGIQTLEVRKLENARRKNPDVEYSMKPKRRSSSVMKSLVVLTSHVRAATYVLVILSVYFITHLPFIAFTLFDTFAPSAQENYKKLKNPNTDTFNTTELKACLNMFPMQ